jgi:hypothetical protein
MGEATEQIRAQLGSALEEHRLAIARLEIVRERVQTEIEVHQLLLDLGRNERLLHFVENLEDELSRQVSFDGHAFSGEVRESMDIPAGVTVEAAPDSRSLADLTMWIRHRTWLIEVTWRPEHGLVVRPVEAPSSAASASLSVHADDEERAMGTSESET